MDSNHTDDFLTLLMTLLWGGLGAIVVLGIAWRVTKVRNRRRRREAAREAQRKVRAWRKGEPPAGPNP